LVFDPGIGFGSGAGVSAHRHRSCPVWVADGVVGTAGWLPALRAVSSELNLAAWRSRLRSYDDPELLRFLEFGFPSFSDCAPVVVLARNLQSVHAFEEETAADLAQAVALGHVVRSMHPPCWPMRIIPLGSVPKGRLGKRRRISHFSFPRGLSVNEGIDHGRMPVLAYARG
jgi:hypothetical protein